MFPTCPDQSSIILDTARFDHFADTDLTDIASLSKYCIIYCLHDELLIVYRYRGALKSISGAL